MNTLSELSDRDDLSGLYTRPGFQLRRAHQIAVGIFVQECAALGLTPPQHSVLYTIQRRPGMDQSALAKALGFDRATIGTVLAGLESRGLLRRKTCGTDRRRNLLLLTAAGKLLLLRAAPAAKRTSERLMSPLSTLEQQIFMKLLCRITGELNGQSRTPVERPDAMLGEAAQQQ